VLPVPMGAGSVWFRGEGPSRAHGPFREAFRLRGFQRSNDLRFRVAAFAHHLFPFLRPNRIPIWTDLGVRSAGSSVASDVHPVSIPVLTWVASAVRIVVNQCLHRGSLLTREKVTEAISGNLCRCTDYAKLSTQFWPLPILRRRLRREKKGKYYAQ